MNWNISGRRGFTLIELLVVVSIIALLIGILFPSLGGARDSVRSVACLANMRSLSMVTLMYAEDSDGVLPRSGHSAGFGSLPWAAVLYEPLTDRPFEGTSYSCDDDGWWNASNTHYRSPHDRREEIDPELWGGQKARVYRKLSSVPRASGTVLYGELPDSPGLDHIMAHFWRTRGTAPGEGVAATRHGEGAAYAFADGHADQRAFQFVYNEETKTDSWNPATAQ